VEGEKMSRSVFEQVFSNLEDIEEEFYHKIEKKNDQIRELQETIKKQGQIIDKLKMDDLDRGLETK
jgi:hemoglobin-like flavoprotein